MKKLIITILYDNDEMAESVEHILHCIDCEGFQVDTVKEPQPSSDTISEEPLQFLSNKEEDIYTEKDGKPSSEEVTESSGCVYLDMGLCEVISKLGCKINELIDRLNEGV